ncbi:MAG: DUF3298 domain-containing protein [Prevotella sp.]
MKQKLMRTGGWLACALALGMSVCGCNGNRVGSADNALTFDSVVVDTVARLIAGQDSPSCELKLNFKYANGPHADAINDSLLKLLTVCGLPQPTGGNVKDALDSFVVAYINDYKKDCLRLYTELNASEGTCSYAFSLNTTVLPSTDSLVAVMAEGYMFTGGAHGTGFTLVRNFEKSTGRMLSTADLFADGGEEKAVEAILGRLYEQTGASDMDALREQGFFFGMDAYVPANVVVGEDSLTFIYQDMEIASHARGEVRVNIARDALRQWLKQ